MKKIYIMYARNKSGKEVPTQPWAAHLHRSAWLILSICNPVSLTSVFDLYEICICSKYEISKYYLINLLKFCKLLWQLSDAMSNKELADCHEVVSIIDACVKKIIIMKLKP